MVTVANRIKNTNAVKSEPSLREQHREIVKETLDSRPRMVPNQQAVAMVRDFFARAADAFELGVIQDPAAWGVIAAHMEKLAHHIHPFAEKTFSDGATRQQFDCDTALYLVMGFREVWEKIDKDFVEEQTKEWPA